MPINRTAHNNGIYCHSVRCARANISKKRHLISGNIQLIKSFYNQINCSVCLLVQQKCGSKENIVFFALKSEHIQNYNFNWLPIRMSGTDVLLGEKNLQPILMIENISAFINFKNFDVFGTFDKPVNSDTERERKNL